MCNQRFSSPGDPRSGNGNSHCAGSAQWHRQIRRIPDAVDRTGNQWQLRFSHRRQWPRLSRSTRFGKGPICLTLLFSFLFLLQPDRSSAQATDQKPSYFSISYIKVHPDKEAQYQVIVPSGISDAGQGWRLREDGKRHLGANTQSEAQHGPHFLADLRMVAELGA